MMRRGGIYIHGSQKGRITAAYYYIKQLGGPHSPQITGDAFPMMTQYVDAYWLQPAQSMLHVFNDVTAQSPVGNLNEMICSELRWEDREGKIQRWGREGVESFDNLIYEVSSQTKLS